MDDFIMISIKVDIVKSNSLIKSLTMKKFYYMCMLQILLLKMLPVLYVKSDLLSRNRNTAIKVRIG